MNINLKNKNKQGTDFYQQYKNKKVLKIYFRSSVYILCGLYLINIVDRVGDSVGLVV